MGVITGVISCTAVEKNNRIHCADSLEVLTDIVCLTSSLRVPCQAWEISNSAELNCYTIKPEH
jgi:hypothetical protein